LINSGEGKLKNKLALFGVSTFLVFAAAVFSVSVAAQQAQPSQSRSAIKFELESKLMNRKMPYEVLLPEGYQEKSGRTYQTLYLLHGLTGHYDDWVAKTTLAEGSKKYGYVIVMPEGNNGWYTDSPVKPNDKFESYIINELIPEIEKKFSVSKERKGRAVAGLSMGGYGALKFGLKHPEKFVLAGSFSGALRAPEWNEKTLPAFKVLGESANSAFGEMGNTARDENDLFKLLQGKSAGELKALPFLYIDCGTEDGLVEQNVQFAELVLKKKIPHEFRQLPGKHNWNFWNTQIAEFLDVSSRFLK
jgi:S-formylglutathione hydrolase FrmB